VSLFTFLARFHAASPRGGRDIVSNDSDDTSVMATIAEKIQHGLCHSARMTHCAVLGVCCSKYSECHDLAIAEDLVTMINDIAHRYHLGSFWAMICISVQSFVLPVVVVGRRRRRAMGMAVVTHDPMAQGHKSLWSRSSQYV
jgi:hypothetical protein